MGGEMPSWNALYASGSARKSSFLKRRAIARVPPVVISLAGPMCLFPPRGRSVPRNFQKTIFPDDAIIQWKPMKSMQSMSRNAPVWMSWLMWGLVAGLYLIGFFQRVAPAVMVDELMREFQIGGALLGNLSATYFYSYTVMQIPSGLLADGIGPRRLSAAAALLAAVGTLMFGLADAPVDGLRRPSAGRSGGRRRVRHLHEARRALVPVQPVRHGDGRGPSARQSRRCPRGRAALGGRELLRLADRDGGERRVHVRPGRGGLGGRAGRPGRARFHELRPCLGGRERQPAPHARAAHRIGPAGNLAAACGRRSVGRSGPGVRRIMGCSLPDPGVRDRPQSLRPR